MPLLPSSEKSSDALVNAVLCNEPANQGRKTSRDRFRRKTVHFFIVFASALVLILQYSGFRLSSSQRPLQNNIETTFDWNHIKPSPEIVFHPCFDGLQCARLLVPLDYSREEDTRQISIALTKYPSPFDITHPRYGGPILVNPGGPGTAAGPWVISEAQDLQRIASDFDSPDGKVFDIVGFDPRGIGETRPLLKGISDPGVRTLFADEFSQFGDLAAEGPEGDRALRELIVRKKLYGQVLARTVYSELNETGDSNTANERLETHLGAYVGTTFIARDVLEITERLGEWREGEARRILAAKPSQYSAKTRKHIEARVKYIKHETEKICFWGYSYGTKLGQYVASMFPDRIGRIVIDGVVDSEKVLDPLQPRESGQLDNITIGFVDKCFTMGEACALYNASGPTAILHSIEEFLESVHETPLAFIDESTGLPVVLKKYDFIEGFFKQWYFLPTLFDEFVSELASVMRRDPFNLTAFYTVSPFMRRRKTVVYPFFDSKYDEQELMRFSEDPRSATYIITCADFAPGVWAGLNFTQIKNLKEHSQNQARLFDLGVAHFEAETDLQCAGFDVLPAWQFSGPFATNETTSNGEDESKQRVQPILVASTELDPVTPLKNARAVRSRFANSGLVLREGFGHCTSSRRSTCVEDVIRRYFQTGLTDPREEIFCKLRDDE